MIRRGVGTMAARKSPDPTKTRTAKATAPDNVRKTANSIAPASPTANAKRFKTELAAKATIVSVHKRIKRVMPALFRATDAIATPTPITDPRADCVQTCSAHKKAGSNQSRLFREWDHELGCFMTIRKKSSDYMSRPCPCRSNRSACYTCRSTAPYGSIRPCPCASASL